MWRANAKKQGFEDVLAELQMEVDVYRVIQAKQELAKLTEAVNMMFAEMSDGYERAHFEPQHNVPMVTTFLQRFDAIYTLNQDTLIEQKYVKTVTGGRFNGCHLPGIKSGNSAVIIGKTQFNLFGPDPSSFRLTQGMQPCIKLHGSFNWMQEQNRLLIVGGNKAAHIQKSPLLAWHHSLFQADLGKPGARLMVIGYSFGDQHINDAICQAVDGGTKLFIIDPLGVDVIDKNEPANRVFPVPLIQRLPKGIVGASRRLLTSTFNQDDVEHTKVMKFFT